ncbi:hypothetical protein Tco_0542241, partial [Tanacetum coccineum]
MKWRGGSGGCDDDVDGGVGAAVTGGGEGGDGVGLVAVTNMVLVAAVEARGGESDSGSDRSGGGESFEARPENSPEKWRRRNTRRKSFPGRLAGNGREEGRV